MRDDRSKWTPAEPLTEPLLLNGAELVQVSVPRQTLISGVSVLSGVTPAHGWPEIATGDLYRIALRRDRVVEVGGPKQPDGWHPDRQEAISDVSEAFTVFEISGRGAFDLLKRGTELSLEQPSKSVVRKLFGFDFWLYRYGAADRFRLHIAHPYCEAFKATLKAVSAVMPEEL